MPGIGAGYALLFIGLTIWLWLFTDDPAPWWVVPTVLSQVALGAFWIFSYFKVGLFLRGDHLIYRTSLGKAYQIPYDNIRTCTQKGTRITISTDQRRYAIDIGSMVGWSAVYPTLLLYIENRGRRDLEVVS